MKEATFEFFPPCWKEPLSLDCIKVKYNSEAMQNYPETVSFFTSPTHKGEILAMSDIGRMQRNPVEDITLSDRAFTNENDRLFFQGLINHYRRYISEHIPENQKAETQRNTCLMNNEKRKIYLDPLMPEIEQFIRQYRRDNPGANIKEILNAVSEHLSAEKGISISARTLRNKNIPPLIRSIAEKEKSGKV